jgi:hypothetical protein
MFVRLTALRHGRAARRSRVHRRGVPALLALLVALASTALVAGGGSSPARAEVPSAHTDAVFYTTDSQALAQQLGAAPSASADYWISVAPYTAGVNVGKPKFAPAGPVVHAQGSRFHALAEIRLAPWCSKLDTPGDAYATGEMLHDWMLVEGFDPSRDAWAVNEAGVPSSDACAQAVFTNTDTRANFREFVHGLFDGSSGDAPISGVVFAANPAQFATQTDVASYRQGLASWYADAPFWQDMERYVHFWAQETYADSRAWGVVGASTEDRAASLNDYFMFGRRLAAAGGADTAAARAFFTHAYTPLGNASWKQASPVSAFGPGFGETDILTADAMKGFISAQVAALRLSASARFGFAVVPKNAGTDKNPIELHIGEAINAADACLLAPCATAVDGAASADVWRAFAAPPEIASDVDGLQHPDGWFASDVTVDWNIDSMESPIASSSGCGPTTIGSDTAGTTLTCSVTNRGGTSSSSVTIRRDTTPPEIRPVVTGTKSGDWYTGDVTVRWAVSDSLSPVLSTDGCGTYTVTSDTTGATFACSATSDGGTATQSVTVKRDATPPTITCVATPATLWPPNGKLVPVSVDLTVRDATSGEAGFVLAAAPATDATGFDVGTSDIEGYLRAQRAGNGGDRTYVLTYVARDVAGHTASCDANVVVPHDQGS